MVQRIDDVGDVFAHAAAGIPFTGQQLRCLVDEVGREDLVDGTFLVGPVEAVKTVGEEAEGSKDEDTSGLAVLERTGNLKAALAGGNHVVIDNDIFSCHTGAEKFVGNDGISSVHDPGVVASLIEHTHVKTQHVGDVDSPLHAALIRTDDHHVIGINREILHIPEKALDELINGLDCLEAGERDRILYAGIMCVKGDDVVNAHADQLLQGDGTVKRFPGGAAVLTALIEEGHDDGDAARLAADGGDDPLQILEVVIRRHMICLAVQGVGHAVVAHVHHDVEIHAADGLLQHALGFSIAESGDISLDNIGRTLIAGERQAVLMLTFPL